MWDQAVVVLCMVHLVAADQFFQQGESPFTTSRLYVLRYLMTLLLYASLQGTLLLHRQTFS